MDFGNVEWRPRRRLPAAAAPSRRSQNVVGRRPDKTTDVASASHQPTQQRDDSRPT